MFEYVSPRVLDRASAYTIGLLAGTDGQNFPQGIVGQVGFSAAETNCTGTILRMSPLCTHKGHFRVDATTERRQRAVTNACWLSCGRS
jgi:hypothetical protein